MMHILQITLGILIGLVTIANCAKKDERECEVCIATIKKFTEGIPDTLYSDVKQLETAFRKYCKKLPKGGKENRFCYYVGGTEDAATGILGNLIKPLSNHLPPEKICEKLKAMDSQICELRFDVKPDFTKLSKLKVSELKKILSNWGEDMACNGCVEKSDYVKIILKLLHKYEPEEWKKVQDAAKSEL